MSNTRYLPERLQLEEEDGLGVPYTATYFPGLVDVEAYPQVEPYTQPLERPGSDLLLQAVDPFWSVAF